MIVVYAYHVCLCSLLIVVAGWFLSYFLFEIEFNLMKVVSVVLVSVGFVSV